MPVEQGIMVVLKTDLPLAKKEWTPEPPQLSSQAIMVPEGTRLLSRGAKVTGSDDKSVIGNLAMITDGNVKQKFSYNVELLDGLQWVQIDLENTHAIRAILVWHYYLPDSLDYDYYRGGEHRYLARVYQDVVIQTSNDPHFREGVSTVYNNDHDNSSGLGRGEDAMYIETREGRWINTKGVNARYVRLYSNGHKRLWGDKDEMPTEWHDNYDRSNDYIEVEVYGE